MFWFLLSMTACDGEQIASNGTSSRLIWPLKLFTTHNELGCPKIQISIEFQFTQ